MNRYNKIADVNINELLIDYKKDVLTWKEIRIKYNISESIFRKILKLNRIENKIRYYSIEQIKESAKKYKYRSDWQYNDLGFYNAARRLNILEECCSHMNRKQNCFTTNIGIIYAYIFSDNTAYIGLSIRPKRRIAYHLRQGKVYEKINKGISYNYEILEQNIPNNNLSDKEEFYINEFKRRGYTLLNTAKTGSRGAIHYYWSIEKIKKKALEFKYRTEWAKAHPTTYDAAKRLNIFEECVKHMEFKYRTWTKEKVLEESKKHNSIIEWQRANKTSYNFAHKHKFLSEATTHMKRLK